MSRKIQTAQRPYTLLVANLKGGSDPSKGVAGNPVKARTGITYQHFPEIQRVGLERTLEPDPSTPGVDTKMGLVKYTTEPIPVRATQEITVSNNDFTADAHLNVGGYILVSGEDFIVGGSAALTATALAVVIDAIPELSATAAGALITVLGPAGPGGNHILTEATYDGAIENYTIASPTFQNAEPTIGPPTILP